MGCKYHRNLAPLATHLSSVQKKCVSLKRRRWKNDDGGRVIFFRSKLSCPFSPDTPCLHIDLVCRREEEEMDIIMYAFVYDMTHRFDVEMNWIDRLKNHFNSPTEELSQSATSDLNTSQLISVSRSSDIHIEIVELI
jgi:hypothetical protein